MNRNESRDRERRGDEGTSPYLVTGVLAGVAAAVGGIYWWTRGSQSEPPQTTQMANNNSKKITPQAREVRSNQVAANNSPAPAHAQPADSTDSMSSYLSSLLNRISTTSSTSTIGTGTKIAHLPDDFRQQSPPPNPIISNLNSLLADIFVRYVQIKDNDFQLHYRVFDKIFQHLHVKMKEVDPYYRKYSSTVQFAGSHYDNLRIKKPDEFDMDIVIGLPLNLEEHSTNPRESDIFIEPKSAGYVQLRMGVHFQKLPMRDGQEWQNNKAAYEWMDSMKYLQRSKFLDWFKGVVNKALQTFEFSGYHPLYYVDGVPYVIRKSESGPAMTLIIENKQRGFQLDVDLVPALKFPESRWPIGPAYRSIPPECRRGEWMVVGKPIKNGIVHDENRSWRIALHNQERVLMHNTGNLRQALRLMKKLRDALGMKKIASYYVKTLFFWEIVHQNNISFWQRNSPAFLFKHMVGKLHQALKDRKIPYFWNKSNNLIHGVKEQILAEYAAKLEPLMQVLEQPQEYRQVARFLLTADEFKDYNAKFLHI